MTRRKTIGASGWGGISPPGLIRGASFFPIPVVRGEAGVATTVAVPVAGAAVVPWPANLAVMASASAFMIVDRLPRHVSAAGQALLAALALAPAGGPAR